jgi:hypothetical protein
MGFDKEEGSGQNMEYVLLETATCSERESIALQLE